MKQFRFNEKQKIDWKRSKNVSLSKCILIHLPQSDTNWRMWRILGFLFKPYYQDAFLSGPLFYLLKLKFFVKFTGGNIGNRCVNSKFPWIIWFEHKFDEFISYSLPEIPGINNQTINMGPIIITRYFDYGKNFCVPQKTKKFWIIQSSPGYELYLTSIINWINCLCSINSMNLFNLIS